MRRLTVAILGNHELPFCTESELDWTFEHLGHKVLKFQENKARTEDIMMQCRAYEADLFVYIHTHGWETPGSVSFETMLDAIKNMGVKTCGFHLDLYWGLNTADYRQDRIGKHHFWKMDYVFTADGGRQDEFKERGVNHIWLPPAVVERGCFRGNFNPEWAVDVAFVGAKGYHPEYPFRAHLIEWLERTYGDRFRRYAGDTRWGGFREQRLNDLYASVKVCVGDSCFGGLINNYWSDRVPETLGRGGFLIHPAVNGLNIPGLVTFYRQDLEHLKRQIDYFVEHDAERQACQDNAFKWVRENETYTNRVMTMLNVMGIL
jgi:hypothetical protein